MIRRPRPRERARTIDLADGTPPPLGDLMVAVERSLKRLRRSEARASTESPARRYEIRCLEAVAVLLDERART